MLKLYKCAIEMLDAKDTDVVIDAYSGIGTITLSIAPHVKKVYGIEVVKEAVDNANENKVLNNINNAEFVLGKCEEEIMNLVSREKVDAIVMDPPRKGSDIVFLDTIIKAKINNLPKYFFISFVTVSILLESLSQRSLYLLNSSPKRFNSL